MESIWVSSSARLLRMMVEVLPLGIMGAACILYGQAMKNWGPMTQPLPDISLCSRYSIAPWISVEHAMMFLTRQSVTWPITTVPRILRTLLLQAPKLLAQRRTLAGADGSAQQRYAVVAPERGIEEFQRILVRLVDGHEAGIGEIAERLAAQCRVVCLHGSYSSYGPPIITL